MKDDSTNDHANTLRPGVRPRIVPKPADPSAPSWPPFRSNWTYDDYGKDEYTEYEEAKAAPGGGLLQLIHEELVSIRQALSQEQAVAHDKHTDKSAAPESEPEAPAAPEAPPKQGTTEERLSSTAAAKLLRVQKARFLQAAKEDQEAGHDLPAENVGNGGRLHLRWPNDRKAIRAWWNGRDDNNRKEVGR